LVGWRNVTAAMPVGHNAAKPGSPVLLIM
jgi:hypothetical protein